MFGVLASAVIGALPAHAQDEDSARGWITSTGLNNSNTAAGSYFAGYMSGFHERDHFDFVIPRFNGTLLSVTLELIEPTAGHGGVPTTYSVYSLGAFGSYAYSNIGTGTVYGTTSLNVTSDLTVVSIALDAAAVAAVTADEGHTFSLGGVDSGELSSGPTNNYDFANSGGTNLAALVFTMTPEPGSLALLLAAGTVAVALRARRGSRGQRVGRGQHVDRRVG